LKRAPASARLQRRACQGVCKRATSREAVAILMLVCQVSAQRRSDKSLRRFNESVLRLQKPMRNSVPMCAQAQISESRTACATYLPGKASDGARHA
jgi:hypothetical protein